MEDHPTQKQVSMIFKIIRKNKKVLETEIAKPQLVFEISRKESSVEVPDIWGISKDLDDVKGPDSGHDEIGCGNSEEACRNAQDEYMHQTTRRKDGRRRIWEFFKSISFSSWTCWMRANDESVRDVSR